MAKKFQTLLGQMAPERRARIEQRVQAELAEIALQDLSQALNLTQTQVADALALNQPAASKAEGPGDLYVTTLRRYVEALGGRLELVASFPDRKVVINQFGEAA